MIHEYEEILERLAKRRKLYLEALEEALGALESERAALAFQSRPGPTQSGKEPRSRPRRRARVSKADQIFAAAAKLLREEGSPQGLTAIYTAVQAAGVEVGKGSVSAVLSRAPEFFSEAKRWHLSAWREATSEGAGGPTAD